MRPIWKLCRGKHLCEQCGNFVQWAWLHFTGGLNYDHCVCEKCASLTEDGA